MMMNVDAQNGLEAWRLLVRSEQPVIGANRIAPMQAILQFKLSPGFDKLEEELRAFEGLVQTYRALFGEEISDLITQAVIKSQMPAEIRARPELQTFARTAETYQSHVESVQDEDSDHWVASREHGPNTHGDWMGQEQGQGQGKKEKRKERRRTRARERARGRKMSITLQSLRCGVTTAENGATKLPTVGMEQRNRCTRFREEQPGPRLA